MIPMITNATNAIEAVICDNTKHDTLSDDGSNFMEGDTYLPMEEGSCLRMKILLTRHKMQHIWKKTVIMMTF